MKQFKQTLYITNLGIKGNCFIEFSLVKSITYKIWVPPTKLFFGSKVILQTDNSPLVLQLHCQTTHYYPIMVYLRAQLSAQRSSACV